MNSQLRKPYDIFPALERLRDHAAELSADERDRLKATVALNAADPQAVALLVDLDGDDWAHIYPPVPKAKPISTRQAIDTFLDTYGKSTPDEDALLERLIFNPVPEYSGVLARQEQDEAKADNEPAPELPDDKDVEALAELAAEINSPAETAKEEADAEPVDDTPAEAPKRPRETPLSLELAKIFVKQGRFDRAHEIISKISLNNPEKSVYFADQLRFLEKLMKIQAATQTKK